MMTRGWKIGCLEPIHGREEAMTQLWLASRYRNALVELERIRRERVLEATRREFPRLVELEGEIERLDEEMKALDTEIKRENAHERRKRATPAQQQAKRTLREQRSAYYKECRAVKQDAYGPPNIVELKEAIKAATKLADTAEIARLEGAMVQARSAWYARVPEAERLRAALDEIDSSINERQKELRSENGLHWGNYQCVEDAAANFRKGGPPKFTRYRGEGRLGVQIQGGMTVEQLLFCEHQQTKLEIVPHAGKQRRAKLWIRVGSTQREALIDDQWRPLTSSTISKRRDGIYLRFTWDGIERVASPGQWRGEAGRPIWCVLPCVYDRDFPSEAMVKQIHVIRRKVGYHWEWSASVSLTGPDACFDKGDLASEGMAAINLGWRVLADGSLRVATWVGEDGEEGELIIPADDVDRRWDFPDSLKGIRSRLLTEAVDRLATWCEANEEILPPEFVARLRDRGDNRRTLRQWRSPYRLSDLVEWWRFNRFAGDEEIYTWMNGVAVANPKGNGRISIQGYRRQEKHLCEWQCGIEQRAARWRKNLYRNFAAVLSRRYQQVLFANVNWRQMLENPEAECNEAENRTAKRNARISAPGEMETVLKQRFAQTEEIKAKDLTQTCSACHRLDPFDARTEIVRQCDHCGHVEDQDYRHCRNLLHIARGGVLNENP